MRGIRISCFSFLPDPTGAERLCDINLRLESALPLNYLHLQLSLYTLNHPSTSFQTQIARHHLTFRKEDMAKIALVTGGNGITGSAIIEYLCKNTTASEWSEIIVTSRSPFKTTVRDERISFIALDLSNNSDDLIEKMRPICSAVTHAFFSSYIHKDDFQELNVANEKLFTNFLDALVAVAPGLENCTLQTGGEALQCPYLSSTVTCTRR